MEAGNPAAAVGLPNNVAAVRGLLEAMGIKFTFDSAGPLGHGDVAETLDLALQASGLDQLRSSSPIAIGQWPFL
jgi:hypothetical protein